VDLLFKRVPAGVGSTGFVRMSPDEFRNVVEVGARWCIGHGYGWEEDLAMTEEEGCVKGADASKISQRAVDRGYNQIGTLGSGNHYLEVQVAKKENILDRELAQAMGITMPRPGRGDVPLRQPGLRSPGGDGLPPDVPQGDGEQVQDQDSRPRAGVRAVPFAGRSELLR
jgi:hypothetical protein